MPPGRDLHAVLLAGGSGTRFWPWSRADRPKQFLALTGEKPLLVEAWRRARALVPPSRVWVVAPRALARQVRRHLPDLRRDRLVLEPEPRDTAPAIVLACAAVARAHPSAVVAVLPTDHVVRDLPAFLAAVSVAAQAARRGGLVCLGVRPDRPATGFGYLECASRPSVRRAVPVTRFVEKPKLARARSFLRSGRHLWNAGMFVWRVDRFLDESRRVAPAITEPVLAHLAGKRGAWQRAERRSVDFAVMERARGVQVVSLDAGWDDVGSWDAAARLRAEAPEARAVVRVESEGSAVFGEGGRLVALVGVPGVVVVDTRDALLVVRRDRAEQVRAVVEALVSTQRGALR
ncbi:MAG TPA: mannose-1-phosphate guanylyltransferase [Candidatus Polarisedimenticolaceae bacterium]|nr:mannose-1-phosphate guanylyltransferase [Candidatus Polarisedimenticolaceae bacterium]